jgi:hypothetical protein
MNRHVAKLAVFWLFCIVLGGYSHACVPLDIEIHYDWLYPQAGTYNIYNGPEVISGGPVMEIGEDEYAWQWGCDSGLNWAFDYADGDVYGAKEIGSATPGVYAEYAVGCNGPGSYDTDCAYVVVLPAGCSVAGPHDSSVHWDDDEDDWNATDLEDWGTFSKESATYDVDFRYSDDTWVCEISNVRALTICKVLASNYPGCVSVSAASDVPCDDVYDAMYELTDPVPDDDQGAPYDYYWCYQGVVHHEVQHRSDWIYFYGDELAGAIAQAEAISVPISEALTCQDAETMASQSINGYFMMAKARAFNRFNSVLTPQIDESEVRAYQAENLVLQAILADLPAGCTGE